MEATDNSVAVAIVSTTSTCRLRREDCRHTKYDSAFSPWKILIGPSDWEAHAQGKEGAEKYRVKNLPNCTTCPGVYELGIAICGQRCRGVIPVYLGKADNVRSRLQQYGRDGAHLENGSSNCKLNDCKNILDQKGPGLFREIFTKGFSIVYRWAPMTNSREAEKAEAEVLDKFDYAWNKGSNGPRRTNDIFKRIDRGSRKPQFLEKFQLLPQRHKGIKIKACELPLLEDGYHFYTNFPLDNLPARVLKFGRSRPILIPWGSGIDETICGVALGHGVVCRKPPSEGRKRCAEHKGMKVNASSSKLLADRKFTLASDKHLFEKDITPVCGVTLDDGSSCRMVPVHGNKRCLEHKGRKVREFIPQSVQVKKEYYVHGLVLDYNDNQNILPRKAGRPNAFSGEQVANKDCNTICGVDLEDGTFCTRQPPGGRKRCVEHKGMRVKEAVSGSFAKSVPSVFDSSGARGYSKEEKRNNAFLPSVFSDKSSPIPSVFSDKSSPTCGMTLQNGGFCSRIPVEGNKRC